MRDASRKPPAPERSREGRSKKKLFVVGCPRSGTTVLQQALNRHPEIMIPPETGYFIDILGKSARIQRRRLIWLCSELQIELPLPRLPVRGDVAARALWESIAERYLKRTGHEDAVYFGEKTPRHMLCMPRIRRLFPGAKFILIYRDGRDVALSLNKVHWAANDFFVNFRTWLQFYRVYRLLVGDPDGDLLVVRYEEFVSHPASELQRISDFLGLRYVEAMAAGAGNREGITDRELAYKSRAIEAITQSRTGNWKRELSPQDIQLAEQWGGHALRALGYETQADRTQKPPLRFFLRLLWKYVIWRFQYAWRVRFVWTGHRK